MFAIKYMTRNDYYIHHIRRRASSLQPAIIKCSLDAEMVIIECLRAARWNRSLSPIQVEKEELDSLAKEISRLTEIPIQDVKLVFYYKTIVDDYTGVYEDINW